MTSAILVHCFKFNLLNAIITLLVISELVLIEQIKYFYFKNVMSKKS